jgi:hypothetical protein
LLLVMLSHYEEVSMARRLDTFPAASSARYPWDEWLDGSVWELVRGDDFHAKPTTFRSNAQTQAKRRGGRARTKAAETGGREAVVLQFVRT